MSRAPTAMRAAEQALAPEPVPLWFATAENPPGQQIVLTTDDPQDREGRPARFYERRQFVGSCWQKCRSWVDPVTLIPLYPQPTYWRHDPARGRLEVLVA